MSSPAQQGDLGVPPVKFKSLLSSVLPTLLALLLAFCSIPALAQPVLTFKGGEATREELDDLALIHGAKGGDFVSRFALATDGESRADVGDTLATASRAYPWVRLRAAEARAAKFMMPSDFGALVRAEVVANTARSWKAFLLKRYAVADEKRLDELLEKYRPELEQPERRDTRYIFKYVPKDSAPSVGLAAKAELEAIRVRILAKEITLTEAAGLHSDAPSASRGGYLGSITRRTRMSPKLTDLIFSYREGEMSPVEFLPNGYYLIMVESIFSEIKPPAGAWREDDNIRMGLLKRAGEAQFADAIRQRRATQVDSDSWMEVAYKWATEEGHRDLGLDRYNGLFTDLHVAQAFFFASNNLVAPVSEEELRAYYEENKAGMVGKGMFKVTRFTVPVTTPDKGSITNRAAALKVAEAAAQRAADGVTTQTIELEFAAQGLEIHNHLGWLHSTDNGPIDGELLGAAPGFVSSIRFSGEGAMFVLLHERRAAPMDSFADRRESLRNLVWTIKRERAMLRDQAEFAEKAGLRMLWKESAPALKN